MTVNQGPQDGSQTPGNGDHSAQPGGIPPQPGGVPAYANAFPAQGGGVPPCNGGDSGGVPPYPPQQGGFPPQPPQKRPVYKRVWFWIVIAAVVLALIGAFMNGPGSGSSSSGTVTAGSGSQPREQGRNDIQPLTVVDSNYSLSSGYVKYGWHETKSCFVGFLCRFGCGGGVRVGVAPEGDRRPGRVEEAFRQSCAGADEGRSGPARLPRRRYGHHRRDGRADGEDGAGMAGRLAGHQDVPGPGRARGEPERGGTRPRPEAGTRDHPGPAALPVGCPRRVPGRPGDT